MLDVGRHGVVVVHHAMVADEKTYSPKETVVDFLSFAFEILHSGPTPCHYGCKGRAQ